MTVMIGRSQEAPLNGWITNVKDAERQVEMTMTNEERRQLRRNTARLAGFSKKVADMPYERDGQDGNDFWIDAEGRGLSFFEEGGQYRVAEVKTEGKDQEFNLKIRLVRREA